MIGCVLLAYSVIKVPMGLGGAAFCYHTPTPLAAGIAAAISRRGEGGGYIVHDVMVY